MQLRKMYNQELISEYMKEDMLHQLLYGMQKLVILDKLLTRFREKGDDHHAEPFQANPNSQKISMMASVLSDMVRASETSGVNDHFVGDVPVVPVEPVVSVFVHVNNVSVSRSFLLAWINTL